MPWTEPSGLNRQRGQGGRRNGPIGLARDPAVARAQGRRPRRDRGGLSLRGNRGDARVPGRPDRPVRQIDFECRGPLVVARGLQGHIHSGGQAVGLGKLDAPERGGLDHEGEDDRLGVPGGASADHAVGAVGQRHKMAIRGDRQEGRIVAGPGELGRDLAHRSIQKASGGSKSSAQADGHTIARIVGRGNLQGVEGSDPDAGLAGEPLKSGLDSRLARGGARYPTPGVYRGDGRVPRAPAGERRQVAHRVIVIGSGQPELLLDSHRNPVVGGRDIQRTNLGARDLQIDHPPARAEGDLDPGAPACRAVTSPVGETEARPGLRLRQ